MRIIKFSAENVKRLVAVDITPDGNFQIIGGRNEQGKTSVLDAIWFALGGGAAQRKTPKPVREGQDYASVTLDLGEYVVTRSWTGEKTTLRVESQQGAQYRSPQAILDGLVGQLSFDPLAFLAQDPKTQVATLLGLVALPFDPEDLATQRASLYMQRTDVGRELRSAQAIVRDLPEHPADLPSEEISMTEIAAEVTRLVDMQREQSHDRLMVEQVSALVAQAQAGHEEAQRQVDLALEHLLEKQRALNALTLVVEAHQTPPDDTRDLEERFAQAEEINRQIREAKERRAHEQRAKTLASKVDDLTDQIEALDQIKRDGLAQASFPVEGLGFDEDGVTYQGMPLSQASGAGRLRVSLAMAMALNPSLRVIRITDGSLLDADNLALIEQMAIDHDFQVWIEVVGDGDGRAVIIEDGQVKA